MQKVLLWPNADLRFVDASFKKNYPKKIIIKNPRKNLQKRKYSISHRFSAITFQWAFFKVGFDEFEISIKFCVFWYLSWYFQEIFLGLIKALFKKVKSYFLPISIIIRLIPISFEPLKTPSGGKGALLNIRRVVNLNSAHVCTMWYRVKCFPVE